MESGIVFDIQHFSVHDGGGIRTNVFLKGCPLHCDWCSNPESQSRLPQPLFEPSKCIGCGACREACPVDAIGEKGGRRIIRTEACVNCQQHPCATACKALALKIAGTRYTVEEVVRQVEQDRLFYERSGGGVTFTGGEPLLQIDFLTEVARVCREKGIHTAVETCGAVPWEHFEQAGPFLEQYLFDVKHVNPQKMQQATGQDGSRILDNFRKLAATGACITARVPVIPGFNSEMEEIQAIGEFVKSCGVQRIDLLTYHEMGVPKYEKIFSAHRPLRRKSLSPEQMEERVKLLQDMGLRAELG
ncbi:MAG: glycyl-radical enzyme activating protein [Eubacteriales bacterium]|jgi:pyruvate formate lyase activating enzyme